MRKYLGGRGFVVVLALGLLVGLFSSSGEAQPEAGERGWLGVGIRTVTPDLAEPRGALIVEVSEGGPAEDDRLVRGDVIVAFDGTEIGDSTDLPLLVAATRVGTTIPVEVLRDGRRGTLHVQIAELGSDQVRREASPVARERSVSPEAGPSLQETVEYIEAKTAKAQSGSTFRLSGGTVTYHDSYSGHTARFKLGAMSTETSRNIDGYVNITCARGACVEYKDKTDYGGTDYGGGVRVHVVSEDRERVQKALTHAIKLSGGKDELF